METSAMFKPTPGAFDSSGFFDKEKTDKEEVDTEEVVEDID